MPVLVTALVLATVLIIAFALATTLELAAALMLVISTQPSRKPRYSHMRPARGPALLSAVTRSPMVGWTAEPGLAS